MTDDLVKRLRASRAMWENARGVPSPLEAEAADRIEELNNHCCELEADLEKAVSALEGVQDFVRDLAPYADQGHTLVPALQKACKTLNELKGQNDD